MIELQPGTEPDPATMQDLMKICVKQDVRVIATEPQFRQKMAETLVAELKRTGPDRCGDHRARPAGDADGGRDPRSRLVRAADAGEHRRPGEGPEMTTALLTIRDVHVQLGDKPMLRGVSAGVARGQITALIGLNGSGKTTLLRAILKETPYTGPDRVSTAATTTAGRRRSTSATSRRSCAVDATLPLTVADLLALALQRRPLFLGIARRTRQKMQRCCTASAWVRTSSTASCRRFPAANCSACCWRLALLSAAGTAAAGRAGRRRRFPVPGKALRPAHPAEPRYRRDGAAGLPRHEHREPRSPTTCCA